MNVDHTRGEFSNRRLSLPMYFSFGEDHYHLAMFQGHEHTSELLGQRPIVSIFRWKFDHAAKPIDDLDQRHEPLQRTARILSCQRPNWHEGAELPIAQSNHQQPRIEI